jgi:HK97 family phage prohead protease
MEVREADDGTMTLAGYASIYDRPYDMGWFTESIARGAGRRSLGENPDVQLLVNHTGLPLARTLSGTLRLSEDETGLYVEADLDPDDPDAQSLVRKMRRGDIDQMSFAFRVTDDTWDESMSERTIRSYSIHRGDVSVVNMGANDATHASVRSRDAATALHTRTHAEMLDAFHEMRAGKTLSAATVEILTQALNLASDAEDAAAGAREALDGLINPESDDGEATVERSITNEKGLCAAIRAVAREPGQDERRAEIITRAAELKLPGLIPGDWTAAGALPEGRALAGQGAARDLQRHAVRAPGGRRGEVRRQRRLLVRVGAGLHRHGRDLLRGRRPLVSAIHARAGRRGDGRRGRRRPAGHRVRPDRRGRGRRAEGRRRRAPRRRRRVPLNARPHHARRAGP